MNKECYYCASWTKKELCKMINNEICCPDCKEYAEDKEVAQK